LFILCFFNTQQTHVHTINTHSRNRNARLSFLGNFKTIIRPYSITLLCASETARLAFPPAHSMSGPNYRNHKSLPSKAKKVHFTPWWLDGPKTVYMCWKEKLNDGTKPKFSVELIPRCVDVHFSNCWNYWGLLGFIKVGIIIDRFIPIKCLHTRGINNYSLKNAHFQSKVHICSLTDIKCSISCTSIINS
jgi:hypothetical protein